MAETATWLVMSEGMGDGGLECMLASWDTKPESWEETLLSRWAPAEGIWRRLSTGYHISHQNIFEHLNVFPMTTTEPFVCENWIVFSVTEKWRCTALQCCPAERSIRLPIISQPLVSVKRWQRSSMSNFKQSQLSNRIVGLTMDGV